MAGGCETSEITYIVPAMDCDDSESAVSNGLLRSPDVEAVVVDLETGGVTIHGRGLDFAALRASIEEAGYQAA